MTKRALMELLQSAPDDVQFFVHAKNSGKAANHWEEAAVTIETPGKIYFIPAIDVKLPVVE